MGGSQQSCQPRTKEEEFPLFSFALLPLPCFVIEINIWPRGEGGEGPLLNREERGRKCGWEGRNRTLVITFCAGPYVRPKNEWRRRRRKYSGTLAVGHGPRKKKDCFYRIAF